MTQGRIGGPMLRDNLVRNGIDLAVETDLLYFDVNNQRLGIKKSVPTTTFDVNGTVLFGGNLKFTGTLIESTNTNGNITLQPNGTGKLQIPYLSNTRVPYVGSGGTVVDSPNLTFDGSNLYVAGSIVGSGSVGLGNLSAAGNTLISVNTNENINLDPNGSGKVVIFGNLVVDNLTAGRITYVAGDDSITDDANLTYAPGYLTLNGVANLGNVSVGTNTITTTNTNGNLDLSPNGTGSVRLTALSSSRVVYTTTGGALTNSANLVFDGSNLTLLGQLYVDNLLINGNTISSTVTNSNIILDPTGIGRVVVLGTNAITVPAGTTAERPSGVAGDVRINTDNDLLEFFDGAIWKTLASDTGAIFGDSFEGDGSTTNFTLSAGSTTTATLVSINGVVQKPTVAYTVSGTTLSFAEAPQPGDSIDTRSLKTAAELKFILDTANTIVEVSNLTQTATVTLGGTLSYTLGNAAILPGANITYDLGSSSLRWGNIYGNSITDAIGNIRDIPQNAKSAVYTLQLTDNGKHISTNSNVSVPNSIFSTGNTVSVYNDSALSINLLQGAGVTLRLAGTASTGDRTLAQYGVANILCVSPNVFVVAGDGLT